MLFAPFSEHCSAVAEKETISLTIQDDDELPDGQYLLVESYCVDPGCDCRKVMINFFHRNRGKKWKCLATIGFGWETPDYYISWMHGDEELGNMIAGSYLEAGGQQSEYSDKLLALWEEFIVTQQKYLKRLQRHYKVFKHTITANSTA